jgi:hypothetical protein
MRQNKYFLIISILSLCFLLLSLGCSSKKAEETQKSEAVKETVAIATPTVTSTSQSGLEKLKTIPVYSLNEGRGDPFIEPIWKSTVSAAVKAAGKSGKLAKIPKSGNLPVAPVDLTVQGIFASGNVYSAIISSPTGSHVVKAGDRCDMYKIENIRESTVVVSLNNIKTKLVLGEEVKADKSEFQNGIPALPQIPGKASGIKSSSPQEQEGNSNPPPQNPSPSETPGRAPAQ